MRLRGRPQAIARAFLDGSMGTAHPDCDEAAQELARWALSLEKDGSEWKRKAARRSQHIADLLDKLGNFKYELDDLEKLLAWITRTEQPLDEIRRVIAERIPHRLAREDNRAA